MEKGKRGWCVWFVGLPGCGKSSISREVYLYLKKKGYDVVYLEMDALRKKLIPNPTYTREERTKAYELFVKEALSHFLRGKGVIMDGTAYKKSMRSIAREKMKDRFAEIYIKCSVETAIARESRRSKGLVMAELYKKALERKRTGRTFPGLGEVIGVDVEFEEDPLCEYVLENDCLSLEDAISLVSSFVENWIEEIEQKG